MKKQGHRGYTFRDLSIRRLSPLLVFTSLQLKWFCPSLLILQKGYSEFQQNYNALAHVLEVVTAAPPVLASADTLHF